MMDERLNKARTAKDPAELLALAEAEGMDMTEEQAVALFARLNPLPGELTDAELSDVTGGGCGQSKPQPKFQVGDHVRFCGYVACEGSPGFPCRSTYIVVEQIFYYEVFHQYSYAVSCPVCHMSVQTWEDTLRPADPG